MDIICFCKLQTIPVAVAQELRILRRTRISGTDRVDDVRGLEIVSLGDLCFTCFAAVEGSALCQKIGTCSTVDRAIHSPPRRGGCC